MNTIRKATTDHAVWYRELIQTHGSPIVVVDGHQAPGQGDGFRAVIGQNEGRGSGHGFLRLGFFSVR